MNKTLKTRVQLKHDIEENWLKATNFTPLNGEAIIYDADAAHGYPRAKIGDGVTNVNELPWFVGTPIDISEFEKLLAEKANVYEKKEKTLANVQVGDNLSGVTVYFSGSYLGSDSGRIQFTTSYYISYGYDDIGEGPIFGLGYDTGWGALWTKKFYDYTNSKNPVVLESYTFPEVDDDRYVVQSVSGDREQNPHFTSSVIEEGFTADCESNYNEIQEIKEKIEGFASEDYVDKGLSKKVDIYFTEKTLGNLKIGDDIGGITVTWENIDITASDFIQGVGIEFGPEEYYDYGGNAQGYMYVIKGDANNFGLYQNDAFGGERYIQSFVGSGSYTFPANLIVMKINKPALCSQYSKVQYDPGFEVDCEYNYKYKADAYFKKGKSLADIKIGDNLSGVTIYFDQLHPFGRGYSTIYFNKYVEFDGIEFHSCLKYAPDNSEPGNEIFRLYAYWEPASAYGADVYPVDIFCRHPSRGPKNYWLMDSYTFPTVEDDSFVVHSFDGDPAEDGHFCATYFEPVIAIGVEDNYNAIKELETATENKVDKTNTAWKLYGTSHEGVQKAVAYAYSQDTFSSIPMRDYKGRLFAQTNDEPIDDPELMDADYQLVNLKYVKENIAVEKGAGAGSIQQKAAAASDGVTVSYSNGTGTITVGSEVPAGTEFDIVGYGENKQYSYRQHVKVGETLTIPETKYFVPDIESNGVDIDVAQSSATLDLREYGLPAATNATILSAFIGDVDITAYIEYAQGYTTNIFYLDTSAIYRKIWGKQTLKITLPNNNLGQDLLSKDTTFYIPVYVFFGITSADQLSWRYTDSATGYSGLERYVSYVPSITNSAGNVVNHRIVLGNFRIMNDLDFGGSPTYYNSPRLGSWVTGLAEGGSGWSHRFAGVIDGCGHSLKNIYINQDSNRGLASCLAVGGIIKNLFIENATIYGSQTDGNLGGMLGVVCTANYGLIQNVYASGTIDVPCSQDWAPPALICAKNDNGIIKDCGAIVLNNKILPDHYGNAITRGESRNASHCISIKLEGKPILALSEVEQDEATKPILVPGQTFSAYRRPKTIIRQLTTERVPSDLSFQSFAEFELFAQYANDEYQTFAKNAPGMLDLINKVACFTLSGNSINPGGTLSITTNKNIIKTLAIEYCGAAENSASGAQSTALGSGTIANGESVAALGRYNEGILNNIIEFGTGNKQQRKTALAIRDDGRTQISTAPSTPNDVVNLKQLKERYKHRLLLYFNSLGETVAENRAAFSIEFFVETNNKFPLTDLNYLMAELESKGEFNCSGKACNQNGNLGTGYLVISRPKLTETIATYSGLLNLSFRLISTTGETLINLKYMDTTNLMKITDTVTKIGGYGYEGI